MQKRKLECIITSSTEHQKKTKEEAADATHPLAIFREVPSYVRPFSLIEWILEYLDSIVERPLVLVAFHPRYWYGS